MLKCSSCGIPLFSYLCLDPPKGKVSCTCKEEVWINFLSIWLNYFLFLNQCTMPVLLLTQLVFQRAVLCIVP